MTRLFRMLLGFVLACILMAGGCLAASAEEPADVLATEEEVLAYTGLTADDIPGVDIRALIERLQLTAAQLAQMDPGGLRYALLSQADVPGNSCEYLLYPDEEATVPWGAVDVSRIRRIAVVSSNDALTPSLMIDLEAGAGYYANTCFFHNIACATRVTELTGDMRTAIIDAIAKADIGSWEASYTDTPETVEQYGDFYPECAGNWLIAFETADGILQYYVYGVETDAPQAFFDLGVFLYQMFW